jgi:uncharacterized membrane protein YeiH
MELLLFIIEILGLAVFSASGAMVAGARRMDLFGVLVLGLVTALGGGTIRDLLLQQPVAWVKDPTLLIVPTLAAAAVFFIPVLRKAPQRPFLIIDAMGLALFTIVGTQKALNLPTPAPVIIAILMGMTTGVAGGILRDVLSGNVPLIFLKEIYATASLAGATMFWVATYFKVDPMVSIFAAIILTLALRLAAIQWNFSLPVWNEKPPRE